MKYTYAEIGKKISALFEDMEDSLMYDPNFTGDPEGALQHAVDFVFRDRTDESRADIYATLVDGGLLNSSLRFRYVVAADLLNKWNARHE